MVTFFAPSADLGAGDQPGGALAAQDPGEETRHDRLLQPQRRHHALLNHALFSSQHKGKQKTVK